ncbi:O-succinylbenzoic acid--CoA ligase [Leucobacter komagatae]|uniref:O-succinylbenzoic acid--CoA ligase n=1 Tax=Leucobacter komagatae TaxID=55969 RepID=A0A542Y860_9MICO|nr:AMP-binding protein [Leucobacter komagatae]TQL44288.1 O-succinylbenzoic acid--CoA ligase [Leucobacter komagatae]
MTAPLVLRAIPVEDRAWLIAALDDALAGGAPILPLAPGQDPGDPAVQATRALPLPDGTAVVIRTSGSSGVPKAVALSRAALAESAEATHEALGGPGQWLVALPTQLISGLQMLVRSSVAGTEPVFAPEGADARQLLEAAEQLDHERRYVSLVPVQLARLLDLAEADADAAEALQRFDAVLVGGQAVSLDLRRRAHALGVSLRRSYGMTETAGGCVYDGVEIGDTLVRIRGGEVQLAGPTLALGYLGDDAQTKDRFVTEPNREGEPVRWYRTGDAGELLGGMLTVTGRLDRVIVSGGVNVSLDEIERVAREYPGWASAVAVATEHPEWGARPSLVVEVDPAAVPFDEVRDGIRAQLGAAATPEWANETERMPRLPGGKPDVPAIEAWLLSLRESFAQLRDGRGEAPRGADEGETQ